MRASRVLDSVEGYGRHDHLCLAIDDPADYAAQARDFLADGLAQGLQVHYVFDGPDEATTASTRDWLLSELAPQRADAVKVTSIGSTYGLGHVVSAADQIAVYAKATTSALADGFTGFRVAADITALVSTPEQLDAVAHYEHLIDRYMSRHPMSALCAYDRSSLGADAVSKVGCIHPVSNVGTSFRWHAAEPVTPQPSDALALALTGEVDRSAYEVFRAALDRTDIDPEQPVVLDVSGLTFVDHHALAALDDLASRYRTRIMLRNVGHIVDRIAEFIEFEHLTIGGPS